MTSPRRVIVGASISPGSIRAMRHARELAASSDAMLMIAHAWKPPGGDLADRRSPCPILREVWRQAAWERITECVNAAWGGLPAGIETRVVVTRGPAGEVLVDLAGEAGDVLVVGAGQRGPLARLWHGRVTRYCVAHAPCPVIAVPPAELARYVGTGLRGKFRHHGLNAAKIASDLNGRPA